MTDPLPTNFTFGDNSTLTSFTDVRGHPKPGTRPLNACGPRGAPSKLDPDGDKVDSRTVEDEEDKENSLRDGVPTSPNSHSSTTRSSDSMNKFWAVLSVHAASAVMSSSGGTMKEKQAAANAAAKSLLEDGMEMERLSRAPNQKTFEPSAKGTSPIKSTHPSVKITPQTVRNAATKASVAVLKAGADRDVATVVASVILTEGGKVLRSKAAKKRSKSSKGRSQGSSSHGSSSTERTNNSVNSRSQKSSTHAHSIAESLRQQNDGIIEESREDEQQEEQDDDETLLSFSISKFGKGKDKYANGDGDDRYATEDVGMVRSHTYEKAALASIGELVARMGERERRIHEMSVEASRAATQDAAALVDEEAGNNGDASPKGGQSLHGDDSVTSVTSNGTSKNSEDDTLRTFEMVEEETSQAHGFEILDPRLQSESRDDCTASTVSTLTHHDLKSQPSAPTTATLNEEKFERKEADLLAAMEVLEQKLDELEQCKNGTQLMGIPHKASPGYPSRPNPIEQLHQLSMLANPTIGTIAENSSDCTHYPPMPPVGTLSVGTEEMTHGYSVGSSSASQGDGNGKSDEGGEEVVRTSSSVRSVLKKPSQCFPILEDNDEYEATWDEDRTVFNSLGEFRISTTTTMGDNTSEMEGDVEEGKGPVEASIEVELMATGPTSPSARLKNLCKSFWKKRVTFQENVDDNDDNEEYASQHPLSEGNGQPDKTKTEGATDGGAAMGPASTNLSAVKDSARRSKASRGRSRIRKSLLQKLRRLKPKSGSSKGAPDANSADEPTEPPRGADINFAVEYTPDAATAGLKSMFAAPDNTQVQGSKSIFAAPTATTAAKPTTQEETERSTAMKEDPTAYVILDAADTRGDGLSAKEDATNGVDTKRTINSDSKTPEMSNVVRNGTRDSTDRVLEKAPATSQRSQVSRGKKATAAGDSYPQNLRLDCPTSSSSSKTQQNSVYMGSHVESMPTYDSSNDASDGAWAGTVLSRFTRGELRDLLVGASSSYSEDDNATAFSSANESMTTYQSFGVAKHNFL